jgi:outer membrane protein insertion porin family
MRRLLSFVLHALPCMLLAQPVMDYGYPREYEIGGITVTGCVTRDANAVKLFTDLQVGDKITVPGDKISKAIKNIWDQKLFSDVRIEAAEIRGNTIFLNIIVTENPQVATFAVRDVSKSDEEKLIEQLRTVGVARGRQVDEALLENAQFAIRRFYVDKGYLKAKTRVEQTAVDSTHKGSSAYLENSVALTFHVDRGERVRIKGR